LLSAVATKTFVAAKTNETLPKPHVIIVGPTGAGKSSLACSLIGGDPANDGCLFQVCHTMDSCTKNTTYSANSTWIGDPLKPLFTIVDTPGFSDSDDEMEALVEEMAIVLKDDIKTADAIVLTIPEDTSRFNDGLISMLKQLEMLFGRKMWSSTMIEISKFHYDQADIKKREEDCEDPEDDECRDEAFFYNEINRELEKHLHVGMNLSIVFIDSYARKDKNLDDEIQQQHFLEETNKLWNFSLSSPEFPFKTVDEVLQENAEMKEEIERLNNENDGLNDEIEELNKMNDEINEENDRLNEEIARLNDDIEQKENEIDDKEQEIIDLNVEIGRLNEEITNLKSGDVKSVEVHTGGGDDDHCNDCNYYLTIYDSNDKSTYCGNLEMNAMNDYEKDSQIFYDESQLHECFNEPINGVKKIHVKRTGDDGARISYWRIVTTSGSYLCTDGGWMDDNEEKDVQCYKG